MRNYRVTEKHEMLKEGVILDYDIKGSLVHCFSITDITEWLKDGWIEEIKEVVYNTAWVEKMKLVDDILSKYHIEDLETLKKILEHEFTGVDMISFARGCNKIFESFNVVKFDDELEKYKQGRTLRNLANIQRDGL